MPPLLRLMRLRLSFDLLAPVDLPAHKGDLLRMALLWHLGSLWCRHAERCRDGCLEPAECLFGRLIEPAPDPDWPHPVRCLVGNTPPPAYVLWDEQDRRRRLLPGELFSFELVLIGGQAIPQLPAFVAAFMAAGQQGMGRERLKARLRRVDALAGPLGTPQPLLEESAWVAESLQNLAAHEADGRAWAAAVAAQGERPIRRLRVRFLSPLQIKLRGKTADEPDFLALARAVVRRLRILSTVHGKGSWPQEEYGPLLDLAETVSLEHHETTWMRHARHSARGGAMPMEGLVGEAWYASDEDLLPLLPALWLGQWVHVGKAAVWGMGRYEIHVD